LDWVSKNGTCPTLEQGPPYFRGPHTCVPKNLRAKSCLLVKTRKHLRTNWSKVSLYTVYAISLVIWPIILILWVGPHFSPIGLRHLLTFVSLSEPVDKGKVTMKTERSKNGAITSGHVGRKGRGRSPRATLLWGGYLNIGTLVKVK